MVIDQVISRTAIPHLDIVTSRTIGARYILLEMAVVASDQLVSPIVTELRPSESAAEPEPQGRFHQPSMLD